LDELDSIFEAASRARLLRNREVLLPDYVPLELPHRSEEIRRLAEVVAPALRGERPNNVFIYGPSPEGGEAKQRLHIRPDGHWQDGGHQVRAQEAPGARLPERGHGPVDLR